jgi:GNAT superfamily N-acetyltransferase
MDFELTEPKTDEEWETYWRLRYERLRKDHGLPPGSEREEQLEEGSTHLVAKVDGRVVGAAAYVVGMDRDPATGARTLFVRFRQMGIDPEFEGRGLGSSITRHVEEAARSMGASEVRGNVRKENVDWFARLGWIVVGPGETLFGEIESVAMVSRLT